MAVVPFSDPIEEKGKDMTYSNIDSNQGPLNQKHSKFPNRPIDVFWNTSSCPIPSERPLIEVIGNILKSLKDHSETNKADFESFIAFGSFKPHKDYSDAFKCWNVKYHRIQQHGRKKPNTIVMEMMAAIFRCVNESAQLRVIMVLSEDVYLNPFLHRLVQRGHVVINVLPHGPTDTNAGQFVWEWHNVANGCPLPSQKKESTFSNQMLSPLSDCPVNVYWDLENCPIPKDVNSKNVSGNILKVLRGNNISSGAVTKIYAFGDFTKDNVKDAAIDDLQSTGVTLVHAPGGRNDAADVALVTDLLCFIFDNPRPCTIVLISGDADFVPHLHLLKELNHNVVNVTQSGVSKNLGATSIPVWKWPLVASGSLKFSSSQRQETTAREGLESFSKRRRARTARASLESSSNQRRESRALMLIPILAFPGSIFFAKVAFKMVLVVLDFVSSSPFLMISLTALLFMPLLINPPLQEKIIPITRRRRPKKTIYKTIRKDLIF